MNLTICSQHEETDYISWNHRIIGDLDAAAGQHESAQVHYTEALKHARSITCVDLLLDVLLAKGRWSARYRQDIPAALDDLHEAFDIAGKSNYRLYEADIRIALAHAYLAKAQAAHHSSKQKNLALSHAWKHAERAQRMSVNMGYYWGTQDADDVMENLDEIA